MLTVPNVPDIENLYVIEHIPGSAGQSKSPALAGLFHRSFSALQLPGRFHARLPGCQVSFSQSRKVTESLSSLRSPSSLSSLRFLKSLSCLKSFQFLIMAKLAGKVMPAPSPRSFRSFRPGRWRG